MYVPHINNDYGFVNNYGAPYADYWQNARRYGNLNQSYFADPQWTYTNGNLFNQVYNPTILQPPAYLAAANARPLFNNNYAGLYNPSLLNPHWMNSNGNSVGQFNSIYNQKKQRSPTTYRNYDKQTHLHEIGRYGDYYRGLYKLD